MRLHRPVLLEEAIEFLDCKSDRLYVDCTLGMSGHAQKILEASSPGGMLLGIDRDEEAVRFSELRLAAYRNRVKIVRKDYRMISTILRENNLPSPSGIMADLGPSLLQLTSAERGFSFRLDGPLDMRMDRDQNLTAATIVNTYGLSALTRVLREFGEEKAARRIAKKIIEEREKSPVETTSRLREIVESVRRKKREEKIHPATQTFQALRIAVNAELEGLDSFIFDAFDSLISGGRLVLIGFHSLEDRIIKQTFQYLSAVCRCPKRFTVCRCGGKPLSKLLTKKPILPGKAEVSENPAARSAKLRALEKLRGPVPREFWIEWLEERK
jgi:16S rRNA (cytosine1402-N4)-methyltransferase